MRTDRPSSVLVVLLLLVGLAGVARPASGQVVGGKPPRPYICTPGVNCPTYPPSLTITPGTETVNNRSLTVTINYCDSVSVPTHLIKYNGTDVTSSWSYGSVASQNGCHIHYQSVGTVTLGLGANTVYSKVTTDFSGNIDTASLTVTYTYVPPATVTVTPKSTTPNSVATSTTLKQVFTITSTEGSTDVAQLSCGFTANSAITSCSGKASISMGANSSAPDTVTYVVGTKLGNAQLTLKATMQNTLASDQGYIEINALNRIRSLKVAAVSPTMHVTPGAAIKIPFVVTNSGNFADTVSLTSACAGAAFATSCTLQNASLQIPANTAIGDTISTTTATTTPATGTAQLTGWFQTASTIRDSAYTTVTDTITPGIGINVYAQNPSSLRVPEACVSIAIRRGVANQCGDLRIAHALPAVRSYSRVRAPVLLYNSGLANPSPLLRIRVVLDATKGTPDSVHASVVAGGVTFGTNSWSTLAARQAFATGKPQLVAVRLSGVGASEYTLPVEVDAFYGGTKVPYLTTDYMANASADSSHLGTGWTISGVEALHIYSCKCSFFWSSGDGEARFYSRPDTITAHRFIYTTAVFDRPDTLTFDSVHQIYTRLAAHRLLVQFNTSGQHIRTITRLGDTTKFYYRNQTDLDSIVVPTPASQAGGEGFKYAFTWNTTTGYLSSVTAPSLPGQTRTVTLGRDASNRLTSIRDADSTVETIGYGTGSLANIATSMIEKRGTNVTFGYDAGQKLNQAIVDPGSFPHINVTRTFVDAQSRPLAGPVIQDSLYMFYGGPRSNSFDSTDVMSLWVDKYDEPYLIVDGHGSATALTRANQYPALVTRTQSPNQRIVGATYDGRGNLASETDSTHTLNGKYATTRYEFDQKWDFVTKIARPDSDSTSFFYDQTTGNRQWQQVGPSSNTRITFNYYASGTPAAGLLQSVQTPVEGPSHTTTVTYSTLANDSTTATPIGFTTTDLTDALGRVIRATSPIDSAETHWRIDTTGYDIMDRVVWQKSYGPGDTSNFHSYFPSGPNIKQFATPAETLLVTTYYAFPSNGVPDSVSRQAIPDSNKIGIMTTRFTRDALDRPQIVIQPDFQQDYYTYDAAGNTIGQITRRAFELAMRYDALNRLIYRFAPQPEAFQDTTVAPGMSFPIYMNCGAAYCLPQDTATFAYDRMGEQTQANNQTAHINRTYNLDGTIATDTMRIVNLGTGDFTTHVYGLKYTYDLDARRYQLFHPTNLAPIINGVSWNSQTYGFNSLNQLISETDVMGNLFGFSYDNDGRVNRIGSAGTWENSTFDLDGRVVVRTDSTADVQPNLDGWATHEIRHDNMHFDARGKLTAVSGLTDQGYQRYSALGTLIHGLVIGPPTHPANWQFDYWEEMYLPDAMGNVRWKWNTGGKSSNYTDSLHTIRRSLYQPHTGRLMTTDYYYQGGLQIPPGDSETFFYDPSGNRTTTWIGRSGPTTYQAWYLPTQYYYDALEHLRIADKQTCLYDGSLGYCAAHEYQVTATNEPRFEEYYYDALGRRVLTRSRDNIIPCDVLTFAGQAGCFGSIERTVYDGNSVLYDIRMPGDDTVPAVRLERDTGSVNTYPGVLRGAPYGRVAYANGLGLDAPLDVIRIGYDSTWPGPVPIVPIADWKGAYMTGTYWGTFGGPGADSLCANPADYGQSYASCVIFIWPGPKFGYWRQDTYSGTTIVTPWLGHVIEGGRDVSNLLYRRSRYVDPQTQTFTQEDPIGLAGGVNAYGFAEGDPVDYDDPFGLCPPCSDAEYKWLGRDILHRSRILDVVHIGGSVRVNKLRTTVNLSMLSGANFSTTMCANCTTPFAAEVHAGVTFREKGEREPDLSVGFDNGVTISNTSVDYGVSTPDGCFIACVEGAPPEGKSGGPKLNLTVQRDATSTPPPPPPPRVEPTP